MYQASRPRLMHEMMTTTRTTRRRGLRWRTAVAAGVKPKNLKALGPENA